MELVKKYFLIFSLIIRILKKTQYLLFLYCILTLSLILSCYFQLSEILIDSIFTISNIYLIVMYNCHNEKQYKLFFKINNIHNYLLLFIKLNVLYMLFIIQIIIYKVIGIEIFENNIMSFYVIFMTFLFCILLISYEVRIIFIRSVVILLSTFSLFFLLSKILTYSESIILLIISIILTLIYSIKKIINENNSYF